MDVCTLAHTQKCTQTQAKNTHTLTQTDTRASGVRAWNARGSLTEQNVASDSAERMLEHTHIYTHSHTNTHTNKTHTDTNKQHTKRKVLQG
jgi:hypothetical protein